MVEVFGRAQDIEPLPNTSTIVAKCPVLKKVDSSKLINHEIKKLLCTVQ